MLSLYPFSTDAMEGPAGELLAAQALSPHSARVIEISAWRADCEPPTLKPATPVKRRGKSMSRRTGQSGHIEKSGKWWVVRWWMDVEGQEKRTHMREKICPIDGQESLHNAARERRAKEIIAASGADTEDHFNKVVKCVTQITFEVQGERWLNQ